MFDVKGVFDWAKDNGEVKAVDRILIKVMLLLIKNKITLTAATIEKMETRMALPEELNLAIIRAAEEVVQQVDAQPADLVIMRTRGLAGVEREGAVAGVACEADALVDQPLAQPETAR